MLLIKFFFTFRQYCYLNCLEVVQSMEGFQLFASDHVVFQKIISIVVIG